MRSEGRAYRNGAIGSSQLFCWPSRKTKSGRKSRKFRFQHLFETAKDGMIVVDAETEIVEDVNAFFLELTGFGREDFIGKTISDAGALLGLARVKNVCRNSSTQEVVRLE